MSTLNQLADQTIGEISSYVRNQESVTIAVNSVSATDITIAVDDAKSLGKGIVEIDDELIYVKQSVAGSGTIQVLGTAGNPVGRGWRSTGATSHVSGSVVRNNPIFPRSQVKDELEDITGVSWQLPDHTGVWELIKKWRLDTNYNVNGVTKRAIVLNEAPMAGQPVRVQYTKFPTVITDNQELTASGLPSSCEDVVRLGAMYRLLSTVDPGKVTATSVSADALDQPVSAGASTSSAKYIFQLYTVRLSEEISKQQANFLNTIQYTG